MRARRLFQIAAPVLVILSFGSRLDAGHTSHPSYSAKGATPSITAYNLICDPAGATSLSATTLYYPADASIDTIDALSGFQLDAINVEYDTGDGPGIASFTFGPGIFSAGFLPSSFPGPELGAVQVFLSSCSGCGTPGGDAPGDTNTHMLSFVAVGSATSTTFTDMGDPGQAAGGIFPTADSYQGMAVNPADPTGPLVPFYYTANPNPNPSDPSSQSTFNGQNIPNGIDSESASIALSPEPSSMALILVGAIPFLRRGKRVRNHICS